MKTRKQHITGRYMLRRLTAARATKTTVGLTPFVRFFSATFGAGVIATQALIRAGKPSFTTGNIMCHFVLK